jgi:hypothetical protein
LLYFEEKRMNDGKKIDDQQSAAQTEIFHPGVLTL